MWFEIPVFQCFRGLFSLANGMSHTRVGNLSDSDPGGTVFVPTHGFLIAGCDTIKTELSGADFAREQILPSFLKAASNHWTCFTELATLILLFVK
jgi:hypothetical protein